ncbi:hypothetical protein L596_001185 [Steinernema carpocapsae]|uniref:Uncharacterized protein n=1 Tax=Steinernema carpocapsae TaxID=34508 RepID=A0A4U8UN05_STECR|nr:hypothetical protein L596_001185 [Steinernema carpocapsae]
MDTTPSLMAVVSIRPNVPEMDPCFLTARTRVPRTADVAEDMLPTTSKLKPGPPSSPPNATISTADMSASRSTSLPERRLHASQRYDLLVDRIRTHQLHSDW